MQHDSIMTSDGTATAQESDLPPRGLVEREDTPGGGMTVGDAVPDMPSGSGLTADDLAQPTPSSDPTGDRATGITGLRE